MSTEIENFPADYKDVTQLKENQVFVFGSNLAGRHGRGAALAALRKFGAVYGQGEGLQGQSYGIPTKDKLIRTLPITSVKSHIERFIKFAKVNLQQEFIVTPVGCGLAGFHPKTIAPMFEGCSSNVILPECFKKVLGDKNAC